MAIAYDDAWRNKRQTGFCVECGKELPKRKRYYCSPECSYAFFKKHVKVWSHYRLEVFERDNWTCQECGVKVHLGPCGRNNPIETRAECDHILAICLGGKYWDKDNLRTLCHDCHKIKTFRDVKKFNRLNKEQAEVLNPFAVNIGDFFSFRFTQDLQDYF